MVSHETARRRNFFAALLAGFGVIILAGVVRFVATQPTSMLRFVTELPKAVFDSWWLGVGCAGLMLITLRRSSRSYLGWATCIVLVAALSWWLIQTPAVSGWLLPEAEGK